MAFSQKAKATIRERAHHRCQRCGEREHPTKRFDCHHKKLRGQGGSDDPKIDHPDNGALLCVACHKWAHDHPKQARALGLIVSRNSKQIRPWRPSRTGAA